MRENSLTPADRFAPSGTVVPFEIRAKGINFRSFFTALERLFGDEIMMRTIERLPDEIQEAVMMGRIGVTDWHPIAWYRELHRTACAVTGQGPELSRRIGSESIRVDFEGVFRALAFALSPESIIRRGPRIFRMYYRPGGMYIVESGPGRLRAHWSGCAGFDACLWQDVIGGCEGLLKVCGARQVDMSVISGAQDFDSRAEIAAIWR